MIVQRRNRAERSAYGAILALIVLTVSTTGAWAVDLTKQVKFSIAAQKLSSALLEFSHQAKVQVIVGPEVGDRPTPGVSGTHSIAEALTTLLSGSSLAYRVVNDTSIAVGGVATLQNQSSGTTSASPGIVGASAVAAGSQGTTAASQAVPCDASSSASSCAQGASSGTTGPQKPQEAAIPEILVKGSRIMNVDVTRTEDDAQPYYIFDSQQIEQSGAANAEDFLKNMLTMNTTFQTTTQVYGSANTTSSINLRGLGTNETLILIDGRRSAGAVGFNVSSGQPDINGIPLSAIERIEVLPSSASAIYGGAALGGVVNIILKKNFNGGEFGYTYDNTTESSAPHQSVNGAYGFSLEDGKTRVMLSGSYSDINPLLLQDRLDLVGRGISTILRNYPAFLYNASNPFPGATTNIAGIDANGNPTNLILKNGTPLGSSITYVSPGAAPGSNLAAGLLAHAGSYNLNLPPGNEEYGLQNQIGNASITKSLMATIRREFTENLEIFTEFSTVSNAARTIYNSFGGSYTVPASAPENPFQESVLVSFPTVVPAPATGDSVTQSGTVGLIAHLPYSWRSELDYTWSRNSTDAFNIQGDNTALGNALASGAVNPFADTIAYPLNLSAYLGSSYLSVQSTLNDLGLRSSGPLGSLPWGVPTLTIGLEHRKEGFDNEPFATIYPLSPNNNYVGTNFGQSQSTNSVYGEAEVPLVTAKNAIAGIHSLELQLAVRSERYTVFASTAVAYGPPYQSYDPPQGVRDAIVYTSTNPSIGLKYEPIEDLTLRTSYATAFLPPTASQLLPNLAFGCGSPCVGITDPRNGQMYNVYETSGGNPALQPQSSRDLDIGLIWEPKEEELNGLRVDLEYYRIIQPNYIVTPSPQQIVSDPGLQQFVTRSSTTGLITVINQVPVNAAEYKTSGWDITADYHKATAFGTFGVHALGTVITEDLRQLAIGAPFLSYLGYPADGGEARTKGNLTLSWDYQQWALAWTTTFVGRYLQGDAPGSPLQNQFGPFTPAYTLAQGGATIPSQIYHNLVGTYHFDKSHKALSHLAAQFGIKNIFNTLPPFDAYAAPYFYSSYGDPRLREYWLSLKATF